MKPARAPALPHRPCGPSGPIDVMAAAVVASAALVREALGARCGALLDAEEAPVAVLLGSGWGDVALAVQDAIDIPYAVLPAFGAQVEQGALNDALAPAGDSDQSDQNDQNDQNADNADNADNAEKRGQNHDQMPQSPPNVRGHAGTLRAGFLVGRPVLVLCGRRHAYEQGDAAAMKGPIRCLAALGCRVLVQTNAAGSLDARWPTGAFMLIRDQLNLVQQTPLVHERGDARFVNMQDAYDPALRVAAQAAAQRLGEPLLEGVYAWVLGPQFETPAEIRMLQLLGAQAVGMSTVPETILARHAGLRVLGLSLITNMAAGLGTETLSHAHTLASAEAASSRATRLLLAVLDAVGTEQASARGAYSGRRNSVVAAVGSAVSAPAGVAFDSLDKSLNPLSAHSAEIARVLATIDAATRVPTGTSASASAPAAEPVLPLRGRVLSRVAVANTEAAMPTEARRALALQALACLDLTSLNDGDSEADIARLCARAQGRHGAVAAVCVWPRFAGVARRTLPPSIRVAAVANFPAGGLALEPVLREVGQIVQAGAQEVDLVLPWRALLDADERGEEQAAQLVAAVRRASPGLLLKVILESGALQEPALIARASHLALQEGADFIKTSTGKHAVGATLQAAEVMLQVLQTSPALQMSRALQSVNSTAAAAAAAAVAVAAGDGSPRAPGLAGLKVSGGIRSLDDALPYMALLVQHLGLAALGPARFRIGASSLLDSIEAFLDGAPPEARAAMGDY